MTGDDWLVFPRKVMFFLLLLLLLSLSLTNHQYIVVEIVSICVTTQRISRYLKEWKIALHCLEPFKWNTINKNKRKKQKKIQIEPSACACMRNQINFHLNWHTAAIDSGIYSSSSKTKSFWRDIYYISFICAPVVTHSVSLTLTEPN